MNTSTPPVAIVTGGARGIGRDIAARLVQDGHLEEFHGVSFKCELLGDGSDHVDLN